MDLVICRVDLTKLEMKQEKLMELFPKELNVGLKKI
jgi:hypothetical protein